jgi:phosphoadenosine phosphosulfate reductase
MSSAVASSPESDYPTCITAGAHRASRHTRLPAEDLIAWAVEHFHPRLALACSFQKEASVLVHMLTQIEPAARVFTIDTGVLFPETLATWGAFERRFGIQVERLDARALRPWTAGRCCGEAKVAALERVLERVEAWITGIRREQAPTRTRTATVERDARRGVWKLNPLADWSEKDVWRYIHAHELPYHPLHDRGYGSIGCAPCTSPGQGREGRWAGQEKVECGLHV